MRARRHFPQRVAPLVALAVASTLAGPLHAERLPFLTKDGPHFVDEAGQPVILRGVNIGNWLLLEMWMQALNDGGIPDQHSLEALLTSRFGASEKDRLMDIWRDNLITERDFDLLDDFGFNVVRLPFWHTLMEDDAAPFVLKPGAFEHLDRAIGWAAARDIHVILDLHGAQGSQGWEHHSGWQGRNQLWSSTQNQDRAVWLWEQIAARYRDNTTVAAYDILNEPWGTNDTQLREVSVRIATAIRAQDPWHVVLLPANLSGLGFYSEPTSAYGLRNIAFTHHFYPGLFGGTPSVAEHQNFFNNAMPEWTGYQNSLNSPFLVGEMNVVENSAGGGEMMRHHYDYYAAQGWATTAWSWKVFTSGGGVGSGNWGMTTNPAKGANAGVSTWNCNNWNGSLSSVGCQPPTPLVAAGEGPTTHYLVIKAGACCGGRVDVSVDNIALVDQQTGQNVVANGAFNGGTGWSPHAITGSLSRSYAETVAIPSGGSGTALRLSGNDGVNGSVYQAVTLEGGHRYLLSGVARDIDSPASSAWLEFYISTTPPAAGVDYLNTDPFGSINYNTASKAEIEAFWQSLSTRPFVVNPENRDWLGDASLVPDLVTPYPPVWRVAQATDALPAGWCALDVGGGKRGGQRVVDASTIEVYSAGADVWNTTDQFRFIHQSVEQTFSLTARVSGLRNTDAYAKGGLMLRTGLDANAAHIAIQAMPDGGVEANWRATTGGATQSTSLAGTAFPNVWLRLVGASNGSVTASRSLDGSTWTALQTVTPQGVSERRHAGLFALSHDTAQFTRADFANITLAGILSIQGLEEQPGWQHWFDDGPVVANFDHAEPDASSGHGNAVKIVAPSGASGGIVRALDLVGGTTYEVSGNLRVVRFGGGPMTARVSVASVLPADAQPLAATSIAQAILSSTTQTSGSIGSFAVAPNARFVAPGSGPVTQYLMLDVANAGNDGAYAVVDQLDVTPVVPPVADHWSIR